ncbi:GATA transcription factor [Actinidia chinensis var. chinensis]|uniref:GATA transcription factor n=1 Tax=Actinidia chinensis var. chinensis TaxID=1590841 RepID=A0A2R6P2T0_ACTCC|nr:GATA transcription factor [Actinidia chinensis var. chinensis]
MDLCVSSEYQPEQQLLSPPSRSKLGTLDDLFSTHNNLQEGDEDSSLEWLSIFVEDCFSSSGSCLPPPPTPNTAPQTLKSEKVQPHQSTAGGVSVHEFVVPGRARSKRRRPGPITKSKTQLGPLAQISPDPPLLHQAYWLADSELILPKKEDEKEEAEGEKVEEVKRGRGNLGMEVQVGIQQGQGRRCSHCLAQRTPQWRTGPMGPKTLCNACGVRYKSGRLLPEYRPAKSPTFVSYKHSNSHKKVLEMRSMSNS